MSFNLTPLSIPYKKYSGPRNGNFIFIPSSAVEAEDSEERAISGDLGPGLFLNSKNDEDASVYLRVYRTGKVQFGIIEKNGDSTDFTYYGDNYFAGQGSSPYLVGVSFSQKVDGKTKSLSITGLKQGSIFVARPTINVSGINISGREIISAPIDVVASAIQSIGGIHEGQVDYNKVCEAALNNFCAYFAQQSYVKSFIDHVIDFSDTQTEGEVTSKDDPFFRREKSFVEVLDLLNTEYDYNYVKPLDDCLTISLGLERESFDGNLFPGEAKEYGYQGRIR